jgi:hypothetical protein
MQGLFGLLPHYGIVDDDLAVLVPVATKKRDLRVRNF